MDKEVIQFPGKAVNEAEGKHWCVRYMWGDRIHVHAFPCTWPSDAVAEACAFRAGANPGDCFELVGPPDAAGCLQLVATGSRV